MSFKFPWPSSREKVSHRSIPFDTSTSLELPLPLPITHRPTSPRKVHFRSLSSRWAAVRGYVKRTLAAPHAPSSSTLVERVVVDAISSPKKDNYELGLRETDEVDEVVVDRSWSEDFETETNSDAAETASSRHDTTVADPDAFDDGPTSIWAAPLFTFLRNGVWHRVKQFYMPRFEEPEESAYQKEVWSQGKRPSLWASVFFIANCILAAVSIQDPIVLADKIFYYGISPLLSVPILFLCLYNFPYEHSLFFQTFLIVSSWSWPFYEVLYAYLCGFYIRGSSIGADERIFTCGSKDFLSTFYYTSALQVVALFGTSLKRLPATLGAVAFLILMCVTIVPMRHDYVRNVINFVIFESVLLYMHSQKEQSSRKLFMLRAQLKLQFERTYKAQVNERQAADSKRRLTSYVFHEVRVPLNTALLAVQNMASRPIAQDHEVEFSALEGSLSMMSKVLNDVLDFNRMDSGRLESLSKPYAFHKVLRSLFIPVRLAADARHLEFVTDLDMRIDEVARRAAYQAMDATPEAISQHLHQQPNSEGVVVGDETRLRQIITNLASNACKFTPAGGKLTIRTQLMIPSPPSCSTPQPPPLANERQSLTATALTLHNENTPPDPKIAPPSPPLERIVVRIEISDTGSGIPPKDMKECKLFSAFNQTEQGRQQGGKGTGLGLALVRQIVKLSGGRLGLRSKVGVGSTFWVELPLGVGRKAMETGPGTPSSLAHGAPQFPAPGHGGHPDSVSSVAEAVDAATKAASQSQPTSTRSESALHGLMDQGGRFELMLRKYDSHSPTPTRTLGDTLPSPESESEPLPPEAVPVPPPLADSEGSKDTVRPKRVGADVRPTYVALPSRQSFALDGLPSSSSSVSQTPTGLRVLVVDDDALTRMLMTRMLERMGCKVATAENGEVALQRILGEDLSPAPSSASAEPEPPPLVGEPRFAVVFLDNQMPKLSGVKVVERLRAMKRTDLVVGVTGNALLTDQKEYLDAGADHVLTKPVLEASLRKMLVLADARRRC
ncbi:histidine kinase [Mycena amicta]|nr:histidine kinase [Mycena amicta]